MSRYPTNPNLPQPGTQAPKIRLGVSACLTGEPVRYNGGHKKDKTITEFLARCFTLVAVCPEAGAGLGTPRPPVRLVKVGGELRALQVDAPSHDVTEPLQNYYRQIAPRLRGISGYVFKSQSPSCGTGGVKVYSRDGTPNGEITTGLFAARLRQADPLLPMEEEGRLRDASVRDHFLTRVFVYHRWQQLDHPMPTTAPLIHFHSRHKFLLLAHNQAGYRRLGRLLAEPAKPDGPERYARELMRTLERKPTAGNHANVLHHLAGFLKTRIDSGERRELAEIIEAFRSGVVPLAAPIALLRHHFHRNPNPYVANQLYLYPDADEAHCRRVQADFR